MPPEPHRLVANVDAALVQQVFDILERQRESDIEHHGEADDLGAGFEVTKRRTSGHQARLRKHPARLNLGYSDSSDFEIRQQKMNQAGV